MESINMPKPLMLSAIIIMWMADGNHGIAITVTQHRKSFLRAQWRPTRRLLYLYKWLPVSSVSSIQFIAAISVCHCYYFAGWKDCPGLKLPLTLLRCHMNVVASQIAVTRPFVQRLDNTYCTVKNNAVHYWFCLRGINRWPGDSSHSGRIMWKAFTCLDVIMKC